MAGEPLNTAAPRLDAVALVGRAAELSVAGETLASGSGLVIVGHPGVGKTRFATEVVDAQARRDLRVVRLVASHAAASIPLGAFGPLVPVGATADVLTVNLVAAALRDTVESDLLLLVDDAHLLDEASAALLHRLVIDGTVVAIVTVRTPRPAPDSVTALWKDGHCRRIDLQALSSDESAELIADMLPGPLDEAVVQRCWRLARGNPMLTRELVRGGLESGALTRREGIWTWPGRVEVAPALIELVSRRLASLGSDARELLALVAYGEPLTLEVCTDRRGAPTVERLADAGFLDIDDRRNVRLAHPLYGEVVRADITTPIATRLHRELALAHPVELADPSAEFRRVVWHMEAGTPIGAKALLDASIRAQVHDLDMAVRLARAAVEQGGASEARLRLADLLANAGRPAEADAVLEEAAADAADDHTRVSVAAIRAILLLWYRTRLDDARAVLDSAIATLDDPRSAGDLVGVRLQVLMHGGSVTEIADLANEVLNSPLSSNETKASALPGAVAAWLATGALQHTIEQCTLAMPIADRSVDAFPVGELLDYGIAVARLYLGDVAWAEQRFVELRRRAAAEPDRLLRFLFSQGLGRVHMVHGRYTRAADCFREAVALIDPSPDLTAWNLGLLAAAETLGGDIASAEQTLARARAMTRSSMFAVDRERVDALLAAARGELTHAATLAREAADRALERGQRLPALVCIHDVARFGATAAAMSLLDRLGPFEGGYAAAIAAHISALNTGEPSALASASREFEALGCEAVAAEAAATAATAFLDAGLPARATQEAEHARSLAARVDAAGPTLATLESVARLTAREHEVATMAGRGNSDREIADALGVSVRTVQTHLYRAYSKLGIRSRAELAVYVADY